jgi:DNA-binding response OmpR family regulator
MIMSGYDYSRARAALFGADDLLPKPLNTEYLLHRIDLLLDYHARSGDGILGRMEEME